MIILMETIKLGIKYLGKGIIIQIVLLLFALLGGCIVFDGESAIHAQEFFFAILLPSLLIGDLWLCIFLQELGVFRLFLYFVC